MSLSIACRREYYVELGNALPARFNPTPEKQGQRIDIALEAFDDLRPGNADEGRLAVQIVLCGAHATETLRQAALLNDDFPRLTRCRAQASSLMREGRAARRILAQAQKLRLATEAVAGSTPVPAVAADAPAAVAPEAGAAAARSSGQAAAMAPPATLPPTPVATPPTTTAASTPAGAAQPAATAAVAAKPPSAAPVTPPTAAAPPLAAAAPPAAPPPPVAPAFVRRPTPAAPPTPKAMAAAVAFALEHPLPAAQIRHDRGVTPRNQALYPAVAFPTDPTVIDALIRGTGMLDILDDINGEQRDVAA